MPDPVEVLVVAEVHVPRRRKNPSANRSCDRVSALVVGDRVDQQLQDRWRAPSSRARCDTTAARLPPALSPPTATRSAGRRRARRRARAPTDTPRTRRRRRPAPCARAPAGSRRTTRGHRRRGRSPGEVVVGVEVADDEAAAVVEDQQRRAVRLRPVVVPRRDVPGGPGQRQLSRCDVDLHPRILSKPRRRSSVRATADVLAEDQTFAAGQMPHAPASAAASCRGCCRRW